MFYHIQPYSVWGDRLTPFIVTAEKLVSQSVCDAIATAVLTTNVKDFDIYVTADGDTTATYGTGYYHVNADMMTTVDAYVQYGVAENVHTLVSALVMFDMFASRSLVSL